MRACARSIYQFRDFVDDLADGHAVIGEHDELRPAVAHLVRHVERAARKRHGLERLARENLLNTVVELRTRLGRVDVLLLAPDDHA